VDTRTRHALKQDSFAQATASSFSWLSGHRTGVQRWVISVVAVLVVGIGGLVFWNLRSTAADSALGAALDTYDAPLALPGAPAETGVYATASERSKAANQQFAAVAQQYGWLPEGAKAHYFAGITDQELGQTASAETELKTAAGAWNWGDRNLSNLAKLALAGLYRQTARDAQAIALYNELAAKPSETVSAGVAQLDLADLYVAAGKQDQARALWAKVKDADKDGAAGAIAAQKLAAKQ
jgi:predicted negative regulator of RcsB-dependent stress response